MIITYHPLSASSICYDPWHPPCSVYVPDSLFAQSLSKFSLIYLLAWHPPLHTPYISSSNHWLRFAAHAHTITTCFAVASRLCYLILVSLSTLYFELYLVALGRSVNLFLTAPYINILTYLLTYFYATHPSNHCHLYPLKCHLIFLSYGPDLTIMQHTTLHTTAVQSPFHYQWYTIIGKQW